MIRTLLAIAAVSVSAVASGNDWQRPTSYLVVALTIIGFLVMRRKYAS